MGQVQDTRQLNNESPSQNQDSKLTGSNDKEPGKPDISDEFTEYREEMQIQKYDDRQK